MVLKTNLFYKPLNGKRYFVNCSFSLHSSLGFDSTFLFLSLSHMVNLGWKGEHELHNVKGNFPTERK